MKTIKHQKQPTDNSCVSTCVAMLLGVPAEKVIEEFHDDFMSNQMDEKDYLSAHQVTANPVPSNENALIPGKLYLLCVPSLNLKGINHSIIADLRCDENIRLYDPNEGKEGKFYYAWPDSTFKPSVFTELRVSLKSWRIDYEIEFDK